MSDEQNKAEDLRPKKACVTCAELIPSAALKCNKCDTYQDWRKHFGLSSTVLALLTALISVSTFAFTALKGAFVEEDSAVVEAFNGFDQNQFVVVASNQGSRPGTIGDAYIWFTKKDGTGRGYRLKHTGPTDEIFIEPGKSKLIKFEPTDLPQLRELIKIANSDEYECGITVQTVQFSGKTNYSMSNQKKIVQKFECISMSNFQPLRQLLDMNKNGLLE